MVTCPSLACHTWTHWLTDWTVLCHTCHCHCRPFMSCDVMRLKHPNPIKPEYFTEIYVWHDMPEFVVEPTVCATRGLWLGLAWLGRPGPAPARLRLKIINDSIRLGIRLWIYLSLTDSLTLALIRFELDFGSSDRDQTDSTQLNFCLNLTWLDYN